MSYFMCDFDDLIEINEWLSVFDWLFEDKFLSGLWEGAHISSLTKQIKRIEEISVGKVKMLLAPIW